ncbi:MAG TPA: hypothetical protein VLV83_00335 [Acidobacteriota bacterium]|nr:hypothetical protein [Acidobacteriota bacterium]
MSGAVLAVVLVGLQVGLMFLWPFRPHAPWFLAGVGGFYLAAAAAWFLLRRQRLSLGWLVAVSLLLRVMWIPVAPGLSEDAYRYLWDGALMAEGENPYLLAPQDRPQAQARHPNLYRQMAHTDRTSVYPPLAQFLFLLNHLLWGPSVAGWKILLLIFEAGLLSACWQTGFRQPQDWALWLLNPLVVLEFYSSAHLDLVTSALWVEALLFLPAALKRSGGGKGALSPMLLGLSSLTKLTPLISLPWFWMKIRGGRPSLRFLLWAGAALSLPLLLFFVWKGEMRATWEAFAAISDTYHQKWRFNSPFFLIYEADRPDILARAEQIFAGACLLLLAQALWRRSKREDPRQTVISLAASLYFVLMFFYACSYAVHPWYTSWGLALYLILGLRFWAGLWLAAASFLSYLGYWFNYPQVEERVWLLWIEYLPFYALLFRDLWVWVKSMTGPDQESPSASR